MSYEDKAWVNGQGLDLARVNDDSMNDLEARIGAGFTDATAEAAAAQAAAEAASQPVDSDLTAIAALTTTAFGRSVLEAADAAGLRTLADSPSNAEAVLDSLVDAKGDLIVGSAADTPARLAVGTNDHVLTADSTAGTGLKWAAAAGGSGIAETLLDAKGDLIAASAADTAARVAVGTDGKFLKADSGAGAGVSWGDAQPLDSDLTAIAALTTTAFGRALLEKADAAAARTAIEAQADGYYNHRDGQAGILAPTSRGWASGTLTLTGGRGVASRFVPDADITVDTIRFYVTTLSAGINVDVAIYDSARALIVSSGSTAGKFDATGPQTVAITATALEAGTVYYVAIACETTGPVIGSATTTNPQLTLFWGATSPQAPFVQDSAGAFPLPATLGQDANPNSGPLLGVEV